MKTEGMPAGGDPPGGAGGGASLDPMVAAFSEVDESQRYRLLSSLFGELASGRAAADDSRQAGAASRVEILSKKVQALSEEKASVSDLLAATKADLERREAQCDAEITRSAELQRIVEEQKGRLERLSKNLEDAEGQLEARAKEVHRVQVENEDLLLKLQRAESTSGDTTRIRALEVANNELTAEIERLNKDITQVRVDKDAEIEQLKQKMASDQSGTSEADAILSKMWAQLAKAKPPLAEGEIQPVAKAGDHLAGAVVELVSAAQGFEQTMSVVIGRYTKLNQSVKVPWDVYIKKDDLHKTAFQTLLPQGGKPVGLLKLRLRFLYRWAEAGMIATDSVLESIGAELESHLRSEVGMGSDPNCRIRDYIREAGPDLFLQHMRELLSAKLAETYGRGG